MKHVCCIDLDKWKLADCWENERLFGLNRQNFRLLATALTDTFTDSASVVTVKMFMAGFGSSGQHVGGEIGAILGAGVGGMDAEGVETAARVLPDAAPLIPVEAQSPKQLGQSRFASGRNVQPNPLADNLGDFVLPRQPCPQIVQNRSGGQAAILAMPDKIGLRCLAGI
jgi:hypothetical protein